MKLARISALFIALLMVFSLQGWSQSSPAEAFKNVTIHTADGNSIESGTIVWRDGVITAVGKDVSIPFDAYVRDGGDSLHVYPGFIDGLAKWGSPELKDDRSNPDEPGDPSYKRAGIQPQRHAANLLKTSKKVLKKAPKHGFTTAALTPKGRMLPGQADLFFIDGASTDEHLFQRGLSLVAQFEEAGGAAYPSTTMALMSQYRQLFNEARAQQQHQEYFASTSENYPAPDQSKVLEALYPVMEQQQPLYFVVNSDENIERMLWLQDELGFEAVLVSGKEAYKKAEELNKRDIPVLASIDLPEKPEWKKAQEEDSEKSEEMKEATDEKRVFRDRQMTAYKADINNISKLIESGVKVGYASNGLKLSDIQENLNTLMEEGNLSGTQILQMITQSTADILGYGQKLGDVQEGRIASFTVFTKPFTDKETDAVYSVTNGELTEFESESSKQ